MPRPVDLRSDTITRPTDAMRRAMADAVVGDDGWGEDPTVRELEEVYAALVGKEAAVFVPSGVMANQIALRVLTRPGDTVLAGTMQHVVGFEEGAAPRNAGIQFHCLDDSSGRLDVDEVRRAIEAERHHQPKVTALVLENTHMASGGTPVTPEETDELVTAAGGRAVHLDGARLFNAAVALDCPPSALAAPVTTVMSCLSKGLCAPVGSVLAGSVDVIAEGRVERKRLGGSMRQAGVLAAAGLLALRDMVARLEEDHVRARRLAEALAASGLDPTYDPARCRTNIVAFTHPDATGVVERLAREGVLGSTLSATTVRLVTHADLDDDDVDRAASVLAGL